MLIDSRKDGESLIHTHSLAGAEVELDLTADVWNLKGNQASVIVGRDVITPGTFRLDGGRKPVAISVLSEDEVSRDPLTVFVQSDIEVSDLAGEESKDEKSLRPIGDTTPASYLVRSPFPLVRQTRSRVAKASTPLGEAETLNLTDAYGMEFFGRKVSRFSDVYTTNRYVQNTSTSLTKLDPPYEWPAKMIGGLIFVNEDGRVADFEGSRRITEITTTTELDDTLNWTGIGSLALDVVGFKFHILYGKNYDKRGIWAFNGRKLWLLQAGAYIQYLDLGEGLEGQRWDIARISRNILMFVNDKYPARIIHLDEPSSTVLSTNSTLAGMIAPLKPRDVEIPGTTANISWLMKAAGSGGSMTAGTCRIKVRAVNLDDNAESRFVQVYKEADPTNDGITVVANDKVSIWNEKNRSNRAPPPLHERWTHIEIWRTTSSQGVDYFLESRVEIARFANERSATPTVSITNAVYFGADHSEALRSTLYEVGVFAGYSYTDGDQVIITLPANDGLWRTGTYLIFRKIDDDSIKIQTIGDRPSPQDPFIPFSGAQTGVVAEIYPLQELFNLDNLVSEKHYECKLSDVSLAGLPALVVADIVAGGPPPMCRKVASLVGFGSLGGVTLCMGKAAEDVVNPTADSRNFYGVNFTYSLADSTIVSTGLFTNYTFQAGDRFVVTRDRGNSNIGLGEFEIDGKDNDDRIRLKKSPGGVDAGGSIEGHIRRAYELEWPTVKSDEDIWYSRTDIFAPESFPVRTLQVSSIGDTFRNMINVGNYVAVIMDSGVHLLFLSGTRLVKDTIAAVGQGTPWERSVVVVTNTVLWGSPEGPKTMTVTTEVASTGMRAQIDIIGGSAIRQWFRDAYDAGSEVDGGVDELNHCVRWRRKNPDGTYQACQFSYRTNRWTLLDDDSGMAYAPTAAVEFPIKASPVLYSVHDSGATFQVNYQGLTHPYDGLTVQAVLDESFTSSIGQKGRIGRGGDPVPVSVRRPFLRGIGKTGMFTAAMLGDVVRFRSDNSAVDGQARVITGADDSSIDFDPVEGLTFGDEFIIGASRFRYRPAPLAGKLASTVKTLDALTIRALPGARNSKGGPWPDPPAGRFTVRVFSDYDDDPVDEKSLELGIFDEDDVRKVTGDRISGARGSGTALELELEMIETRSDFRLELIEAEIREEGDQLADVSMTE